LFSIEDTIAEPIVAIGGNLMPQSSNSRRVGWNRKQSVGTEWFSIAQELR
jgi:hypothetical protein